MHPIRLLPPSPEDRDDLLAFEVRNRSFFEANINARPVEYYMPGGVDAAIASATEDARLDRAYQYLIRDANGALVGRVNLTRVRRAHFHSAELGYRIGEAETGKGYARAAVRQVVATAFSALGLVRIEATSRPENVGSTRILLGAGFVQYGRSSQSFELGGVWYDLLHFERRAPT